jgi:flavorubredoxin
MDADIFPASITDRLSRSLSKKKSNFDPVNNMLAYHPVEQHAYRTAKRDELVDLMELTYNADAVIIGTPTLSRSALTTSHQFVNLRLVAGA